MLYEKCIISLETQLYLTEKQSSSYHVLLDHKRSRHLSHYFCIAHYMGIAAQLKDTSVAETVYSLIKERYRSDLPKKTSIVWLALTR